MKSRTLTKKVFNNIRAQLLTTDRNQSDIAADFNISSSTVSTVNVEGTWENHLGHKKAQRSLSTRRKADVAKSSVALQVTPEEVEQVVGTDDGVVADLPFAPSTEEQLARDLVALEARFENALEKQSERISVTHSYVNDIDNEFRLFTNKYKFGLIAIAIFVIIALVK